MLILSFSGQRVPSFRMHLYDESAHLNSNAESVLNPIVESVLNPTASFERETVLEYWSHQQTYVSTGFGDLSFAPCPRLNLDKPGERPTRFNSKGQECISALVSFYSTQGPTPLLLFLVEFNPRQSFYIMVMLPNPFRGS